MRTDIKINSIYEFNNLMAFCHKLGYRFGSGTLPIDKEYGEIHGYISIEEKIMFHPYCRYNNNSNISVEKFISTYYGKHFKFGK